MPYNSVTNALALTLWLVGRASGNDSNATGSSVILGPVERRAAVLFVTDGTDGNVVFREFDVALPLAARLDAVSVNEVPENYRVESVTILLLQEVKGETDADAFRQLQEALHECTSGRDVKAVA